MTNLQYILLVLSALATIVGIWDIKKTDLKNRKTIFIKSFLTLVAVGTLIGTFIQVYTEYRQSIAESNRKELEALKQRVQDSITIRMLTDTKNNTGKIQLITDSIVTNLKKTSNEMIVNFKATLAQQQNIAKQTYRLQTVVPSQLTAAFTIYFYNEKLYQQALKMKPSKIPFSVYLQDESFYQLAEASDAYKDFDKHLTDLLKDFDIRIWMLDKNSKTLLAADNVLDLSKLKIRNEYDKYGTIEKMRPFASLILDESCKCFRLNLLNINVNVLHKDREIVSVKDLEGSNFNMALAFKNFDNEDSSIQTEESNVKKAFTAIKITNFYLNAGLTHRCSYFNLQEKNGLYKINNFSWTEHE